MSTSLLYHTQEQLPFLSFPKARITRSLERTIIELRPKMSITDVSSFFDIDWKTVKECEKKYLRKKFRHIPLKDVRIIGVDELFVRIQGREKYITIVRDLESGAVLYVGDGKGSESLNGFLLRLIHSKAKISTIAMDMSKAYISWVEENLPHAQKVFDNFQAETAFKNWCFIARKTEIKELIDMAKTIENNLDGITAYWTTNAISNAGMEGVNNKVRWLIRQAYEFKDKDYFILKVYNLPNTKIEAVLCVIVKTLSDSYP